MKSTAVHIKMYSMFFKIRNHGLPDFHLRVHLFYQPPHSLSNKEGTYQPGVLVYVNNILLHHFTYSKSVSASSQMIVTSFPQSSHS